MKLLGGIGSGSGGCRTAAIVIESDEAPWDLQVALIDSWSRRHGVCISSWIHRKSCSDAGVDGIIGDVEALECDTVVLYYSMGSRRFCDRTRLVSTLKRKFRVYTVS
ncbi:MAG: hypothetical protein GSR78_00735 [Desulfurococcales archaeon]|nr:hypothetical protein [Desulfurococcales archaeon]